MQQRLVLTLGLTLLGSSVAHAWDDLPDDSSRTPKASASVPPKKEVFAGKVVLLRDALARRGIETFEEMKGQVVLETRADELIPIVSDWRGRAFFQDKRLRDRNVQLVAYRPKGTPYLKVLMVFTFDKQGVRQYTDYWCDVCAIPTFEIKPCECCRDSVRLRFQPRDLPDYVKGRKPKADMPNDRNPQSQLSTLNSQLSTKQ